MKIAILSRNQTLYSTRRLIEAGLQRGHAMEVIDPLKCDIITEEDKPSIFYKQRYLHDVDAIIPRIGASITFYGAAVIRQFEMMNVFSVVKSQALMRSRDKLRSLQLLSSAGVGLPKTVFTNYSKAVTELIDHVGGPPLIIKLLEGTQGLGVVLADNRKAAMSVIEAFHGLRARVIIQEFIAEARGGDIRAFVVGGKVIGAMKRQAKDGDFRSNLHRGGTAFEVKLSREEKTAATKAANAMGLAVAGVDMLQSKRGPLILEVNSSPGLEGFERATSMDAAGKVIEYIERNRFKKITLKERLNA